MSNISPFGSKNPPWARGVSSVSNSSGAMINQANSIQQQLLTQNALGAMNTAGVVQYQQPQVFQTQMNVPQQNLGIGLSQLNNPAMTVPGGIGTQSQIFSQVGAITYPTPRSLNANAYQNVNMNPDSALQAAGAGTKQRVFTGTVTKVHDNFGFVDEDVFFQTSACIKGSNPSVGDRVLVEASYNANMPFKWSATRIQVLPISGNSTSRHSSSHSKPFSASNSYNAVPPPVENSNSNYNSNSRMNQRVKSTPGGRGRSRERSREDDENERKKRREDRTRERDEKDKKMSPLPRRRSRSPKVRRRPVIVPRYMVHIPKIALDLPEADYLEIRRRYANLYVPSDFFNSQFRWVDAFPPNTPFALNKPCSFHIMHKDVDPFEENTAILEPPDADYLFSAKVMLLSMPTMQEVYQKCCSMAEDREKKERDSEERDFVHPTRLVNFLVGLRGKNETMALGGPWSPSCDGPDPEKNPSVLINTAIRTCRALTGIDLSTCTQWYRFVELYYRRGESTHKGKVIPARVETVVLFLPDVWSCIPTRLEWDSLQHSYKQQVEQKLAPEQDADGAVNADEKDDEDMVSEEKLQPTHYSELDTKTMNVVSLRNELKARGLNSKGLKSQLVARLAKALKAEAEKVGEDIETEIGEPDSVKSASETDEKTPKKEKDEENKIDEKEKLILQKRYTLPEAQHIIVHPSRVAKSGKFDCTIMSLSLLLDYRPEDTKEHSFEVSLFAELFNEMLMRDFGFNIYKSLRAAPEKPKEDERKKKDEETKIKKDDDKKSPKDEERKKDGEKEEKKVDKDLKKDESKAKNDEDEEDDDDDDEKKEKRRSGEKDRRKRDRPKLITKDPQLLLSFVYFDQTHCGYIFEKDIEDLLFTLGLSLSRAQVRKLVSKVITRDSLHYRKLTDGSKEEKDVVQEENIDKELNSLLMGNKGLLPIFKEGKAGDSNEETNTLTKEQIEDGYVIYQGGLLHVEKLISKLKRVEKACADTEERLVELKSDNKKLTEKATKNSQAIKDLNNELKECKDKLNATNSALDKATSCSKLFHSTLKDIKKQIEPVINTKLLTDDVKVTSHESRWSEPEEKPKIGIKEESTSTSSLDSDNKMDDQ